MNKYLGQHFLINETKLGKIVGALELKINETVIEIGPGHGELTVGIRHQTSSVKIIAIEKDKKLVQFLQRKFVLNKNTKIIEGDALKVLKSQTKKLSSRGGSASGGKSYKIVGNIPYYITGRLLRIISELKNKPSLVVLTIQKEVGQRIVAKPPQMNLLAASVQFWAEPKIVGYINRKDFRPKPLVDSAIIKLTIKNRLHSANDYYRLIKIIFKQPRKTIKNNLAKAIEKLDASKKNNFFDKLKKLGIDSAGRPQNLGINDLLKIQSLLKSIKSFTEH